MGQWQYMMGPKERCRNILGLVYAEDAMKATGRYDDEPHGKDWYADLLSYMASLHVPCAVSPIHKDPYDSDDVRQWIERHLDPDTMKVADEYKDKIPKVGDTVPFLCLLIEVEEPTPARASVVPQGLHHARCRPMLALAVDQG